GLQATELYNAACELALCIPLVGKGKELNAEQLAERRRYADQAMDMLRHALSAGADDLAHMNKDTDLDPLRGREDFKQLLREIEKAAKFPAPGEIASLTGHTTGLIESVAFAPDSRRVLSSGYDNTVRLWDAETRKEIRQFTGHKGLVHGLAFSADGRHIVTSGSDGTFRLWDAESGKEIRTFKGHKGPVRGVAIFPDGKQRPSCGQDGTRRLCKVDADKESGQLKGHKGPIAAVAAPRAGRRALSGGADGIVRFWDVPAGKAIHRLTTSPDQIQSVALSANGRWAAAGTRGGFAYVWDLETGRQLHRLEGHWVPVRAVGFTPDSRRLVAANTGGGLVVYDVETGRELCALAPALGFGGLAIAPDGQRVVTANNDGKVHVWTLSEESLRAADLARLGRRWEQAAAAFDQAVQKQPGDVSLRLNRGRFHARSQHWEKAIADYTAMLQTRADDADLWVERGRCYAEAGQPDKAAADFVKALEILPESPAPWTADRGGIDDELVLRPDLFDRVAKLRPKDKQLRIAKVRRHAERGQWREAAAAMAKVIELDPADHWSWYCQAPLLLEIGDMDGYRRVCQELLTRFGKTNEAYIAERAAKTCLLVPNAVPNLSPVLQLAERAVTGTEKQAI